MSAAASIPVAARWCAAVVLAAALGAPASVRAQEGTPDAVAGRELAARVDATGDGTVHFSFAARPGVCGNGRNVTVSRDRAEWESDCEPGPVRVSLTRRGGRVTAVRGYVGGRWRAREGVRVSDLGDVPAAAAAAYLMSLAERLTAGPAEAAIFPATLADSVTVWPALLRLARDDQRPAKVRQQAVFWVGQAAGEAATRELSALVDENDTDIAVRERAVFALSQRPADEAVPALLRVARTSPSPRLRKSAIFWLGQSKDRRALAYFEQVLAGKP
ncbi:MAG: HEAT repeat domain-containing protein [Gemmatimonadaceae bacterium]